MIDVSFIKMHGIGNDFVIVDNRKNNIALTPKLISRLSNRKTGIGCDQFIVMENSDNADVFMRIYNGDGSEAGACGNASRCVASLIIEEKGREQIKLETISGILSCWKNENGLISVNMGEPKLEWSEIPLKYKMETSADYNTKDIFPFITDDIHLVGMVNMGNPHCILACKNVDDVDIEKIGPMIENSELFPEKTNVEFIEIISRNHIKVKVWERGSGVTLACGSGSCGVLVAAVRKNLTDKKAKISLDGGDLFIEWRESDNSVILTGPAQKVFTGIIDKSVL